MAVRLAHGLPCRFPPSLESVAQPYGERFPERHGTGISIAPGSALAFAGQWRPGSDAVWKRLHGLWSLSVGGAGQTSGRPIGAPAWLAALGNPNAHGTGTAPRLQLTTATPAITITSFLWTSSGTARRLGLKPRVHGVYAGNANRQEDHQGCTS